MHLRYDSPELIIFESALFRTTSTLVIGTDFVLVVDPTWLPAEIAAIHAKAEIAGRGKRKFLLFTHSDYDHIIGYGKFAGYETIASQHFVDNPDPAASLDPIRKFDDEYYISREHAIDYPRIDHVIGGEGQSFSLGAEQVIFYQARGHNRDGLLTHFPDRKLVVAGDYLSNIEFPYLYDSLTLYRKTLDKFERLIVEDECACLVPGHGDPTRDKTEMAARLRSSRIYLDKLEAALRQGREFDLAGLLRQYEWPVVMQRFHAGNVALVQRELGMV